MIKIECEESELVSLISRLGSRQPIHLGDNKEQDLRNLIYAIRNNDKIAAIKAVRALTGLGPKEAQDMVFEALEVDSF